MVFAISTNSLHSTIEPLVLHGPTIMMGCNVFLHNLLFVARRSVAISFVMSIFVNIGMWFERFVIIVTSLHRDFLPSLILPTIWDVAVYVGTLGIFFTLFLLFARAFPVIVIAEVKSIFFFFGCC